ncbi:hypothetical protein LWI29_009123 [Acer saccharum]|uniref:Uncharacterized protein n=1 Tax=Acer saccharum TaxID=4024 RepID=A0AA39SUH2_ACESA|nr:hypothetical protein LWI29_009123 [Acer saccharum]
MKLPRVFDDMVDGDETLDGNRCVVGGVEATHDGFDGGGARLGHSFKDCTEPGPGKEATTEAMARLNVWLRTDSPPKRVTHRRGPFEKQSWGNKGGRPYNRADNGNWRAGATRKGTGNKPSESYAGDRSRNDGHKAGLGGDIHAQSSKFPDPNILASSSSSIPPISKTVKWKRAARSKGGLSDLGEINSLGKRRSLVLEDVVQFTSKRAKDGLSECGDAVRLAEGNFSLDNIDNAMGGFVTVAVEGVDTAAFLNLEAIRQVVTQPESVTSHEVLSLVSDSL